MGLAATPRASDAARLQRYVLAAAGPVAVAGANFLLSFAMLRLERPEAFGIFTVLFAAAAFTIALSSALFAAPLHALHASAEQDRAAVSASVTSAAVAAGLLAWPAYVLLALAVGVGAWTAMIYGLFATLTILRSVGRAWRYAAGGAWRVTLSDMTYAGVTLATFGAAVSRFGVAPADAVYASLALGSALAVASLGRGYVWLLLTPHRASAGGYRAIWRAHARWSLQAVAAIEAVANAHIYLLTFLAGPATIAPIAASALLVRPINVIQNALIDYERAQLARSLSVNAMHEVDRSMRLVRAVLLLVWSVTVALGATILLVQPTLVFPAAYDPATLRLAAALWAAVSLAIILQVPGNVLLQAAGAFRTLAGAALRAAMVSVVGVLLAIAFATPVWTIAAIVPGWLVSSWIVARAVAALRRERGPASPLPPVDRP
ncbi:hypothetical protein [Sphingomonas jatrophae]|uniref:Membrane protein involved in the export of O-antigen and teichoic acid n=1 Tax=Sphingomonas jatrophae TaxID=1166337 RepID=A0A1I6M692_9SPHN|nr:hypothetical protein [Sphingomonas jatrophae]SFS11022.1 hypothetical protein SAMN05192580_3509 [Sphingomonas jatrophae]